MTHPLEPILHQVAVGEYPPADGTVVFGQGLGGFAIAGVFAFTAHFVVAADVDADEARRRLSGLGVSGPTSAGFLVWLGRQVGRAPATYDLVFTGTRAAHVDPVDLVETDGFDDHPRVRRATEHRTHPRVFTDAEERGVLVVGRGVCGRWEAAFEVDERARNRGLGRRLISAARTTIPAGEPLFIQVAPGNVASVRSVLAAGYQPIGAEVLFWK